MNVCSSCSTKLNDNGYCPICGLMHKTQIPGEIPNQHRDYSSRFEENTVPRTTAINVKSLNDIVKIVGIDVRIVFGILAALIIVAFFMLPYYKFNISILNVMREESPPFNIEVGDVEKTLSGSFSGLRISLANLDYIFFILLLPPMLMLLKIIKERGEVITSGIGGLYSSLSATFIGGLILTVLGFFWYSWRVVVVTPNSVDNIMSVNVTDSLFPTEIDSLIGTRLWESYDFTAHITSVLPSVGFLLTILLYVIGISITRFCIKNQ